MTDALAQAEISFVENLRRIVVIARVDESSGVPTFLPSVDVLLRWLTGYHEAFLQANQRWYGGRLHSFHHRQLTLAGRSLLAMPDEILQIGRRLLEIGLSLALSVPVEDMTRYPLVLPTLRSELPGLYVQIECDAADTDVDTDSGAATDAGTATDIDASLEGHASACAGAEGAAGATGRLSPEARRALAAHVDSGGSANLLLAVAELRYAGLAEHEAFNRAGFSVARPGVRGTRPMHRLHRVAPCSDYMGWHIDAAGDVFPCIGMVGHAPARLGNIAGPFIDVLHALASTRDAMVGLAARGPTLAEPPSSGPFDLCALHREAVTGLASF